MKFICPLSGVTWTTPAFSRYPGGFREQTQTHPIFELPVGTLLSRAADFYNGNFEPVEKRLLFLALLNASKLIEWRSTANPSDPTIVANFERVAKTLGWLDIYSWDGRTGRRIGPAFPKFAITKDTKQLLNISHWLDTWQDARTVYESGSRRESILERISRRERALQKLIMNTSLPKEKMAWLLAHWAADAADFPTRVVNLVTTKDGTSTGEIRSLPLRDYWIELIVDPNPYAGNTKHMLDLLDYLAENLEHGTIYAYNLMTLLRKRLNAGRDELGIGDDDEQGLSSADIERLYNKPFKIIPDPSSPDSIEDENQEIIAAKAPTHEPARSEYKTLVEFLTAKAAWILAVSRAQKKGAK